LRRDSTPAERKVWRALRQPPFVQHKFRRQHTIGPFIVDFVSVSARLIVELDGGQHALATPRDERRTNELEHVGFRVMRFWNSDVEPNLSGVLATIAAEMRRP
jgi:very-short-patch-repair endonuclease